MEETNPLLSKEMTEQKQASFNKVCDANKHRTFHKLCLLILLLLAVIRCKECGSNLND